MFILIKNKINTKYKNINTKFIGIKKIKDKINKDFIIKELTKAFRSKILLIFRRNLFLVKLMLYIYRFLIYNKNINLSN